MRKIMIVEDDPKIAEHLQSYIQKYGFPVAKATDFHTVMDTFHQHAPDLVLLDINLPSYDGYYWCRQIRKESICPVIFISARVGEMDQVMALENGGDDGSGKTTLLNLIAKIQLEILIPSLPKMSWKCLNRSIEMSKRP